MLRSISHRRLLSTHTQSIRSYISLPEFDDLLKNAKNALDSSDTSAAAAAAASKTKKINLTLKLRSLTPAKASALGPRPPAPPPVPVPLTWRLRILQRGALARNNLSVFMRGRSASHHLLLPPPPTPPSSSSSDGSSIYGGPQDHKQKRVFDRTRQFNKMLYQRVLTNLSARKNRYLRAHPSGFLSSSLDLVSVRVPIPEGAFADTPYNESYPPPSYKHYDPTSPTAPVAAGVGPRRPPLLTRFIPKKLLARLPSAAAGSPGEWFDVDDGRPLVTRSPVTGRFVNPWSSSATDKTFKDFLSWSLNRPPTSSIIPTDEGGVLPAVREGPDNAREPLSMYSGEGGVGWLPQCPLGPDLESHLPLLDGLSTSGWLVAVDDTATTTTTTTSNNNEGKKQVMYYNPPNPSVTWFGHSTSLIKVVGGPGILTDPQFSPRASPVNFAGPPRFRGFYSFFEDDYSSFPSSSSSTAGALSDGVRIEGSTDCVLISHDHFDHLDVASISRLEELRARRIKVGTSGYDPSTVTSDPVPWWRYHEGIRYFVPLGIKDFLMLSCGVPEDRITEMGWWDAATYSLPARSLKSVTRSCPSSYSTVITCTPAQHWCSRTPWDKNKRLWCGFSVRGPRPSTEGWNAWLDEAAANQQQQQQQQEQEQQPSLLSPPPPVPNLPVAYNNFFFAGDTGLPQTYPLFRLIGTLLGPFSVSLIPVGAYEPNWFMRNQHCRPLEAVEIAQQLNGFATDDGTALGGVESESPHLQSSSCSSPGSAQTAYRMRPGVSATKNVCIHWGTFPLADEPYDAPLREVVETVRKRTLNGEGTGGEFIALRHGETYTPGPD